MLLQILLSQPYTQLQGSLLTSKCLNILQVTPKGGVNFHFVDKSFLIIYFFILKIHCIDIDPRGIVLVVGRVHGGFGGAWWVFLGLKGVLGGVWGV